VAVVLTISEGVGSYVDGMDSFTLLRKHSRHTRWFALAGRIEDAWLLAYGNAMAIIATLSCCQSGTAT
jgi:hypothetical protein